MNKVLFTIFLGLATLLHGSEVDNYYAWGEEIKDSSSAFNDYLNTQVRQSLEKLNAEDVSEDGAVPDDSFAAKSKWAQAAVLVAGVTMNVLFAWVLFMMDI